MVIIGGGLAGLAAASSAHERAAAAAATAAATGVETPLLEVVIVEKMPKLGGNSMKASSGINAVTPASGDSEQLFQHDTTASGGGLSKPELVAMLAVRWQYKGNACSM